MGSAPARQTDTAANFPPGDSQLRSLVPKQTVLQWPSKFGCLIPCQDRGRWTRGSPAAEGRLFLSVELRQRRSRGKAAGWTTRCADAVTLLCAVQKPAGRGFPLRPRCGAHDPASHAVAVPQRQLLDELMGKDRNAPLDRQDRHFGRRMTDDDVCR